MTEPESPPPEPAAPKKRRVLTEAQREILARGREAAAAKRHERAAARSLEDVAAKHGETFPAPPPELPDMVREAAEADEADEITEYGLDAAVPPDESNPHKRNAPTMEQEVQDFVGETPVPATLDDLMSLAPIGDGNYYISVERRLPKVWGGVACAGMLRPITRYLTTSAFKNLYGGGEYQLILYGPPKRGGIYDPETRRIRPKALTKPVRFLVPLDQYPPTLFEDLGEDEDDNEEGESMRHYPPNGGGTTVGRPWESGRVKTNAEAKMFEAQLSFEERQAQRQDERERAARAEEQRMQDEAEAKGISMAQLLVDQKNREAERLERAHREQIAFLERQHQERINATEGGRKGDSAEALGNALSQVIGALKPNGSSDKQLQDLVNQHAREMERVQAQIKDAGERADQRVREAEGRADRAKEEADRRADERIRDIERRAEERMKEAHERADKRVKEIEDATRRIVEDARTQAQARLDDERRNHDRDLRGKDEAFGMRLETQKTSYETRLAGKDEELARLRAECDRYRSEADKNKDLPKRIQEFSATAEALGFARSDGAAEQAEPADLKTLLIGLGADLIRNAPAMIQSAGQTVQQLRGQAPQQSAAAPYVQQASQRQLPPRLHNPAGGVYQAPAFGTEDGATFMGDNSAMQRPKYPPGYQPPGPTLPQQQPAAPPVAPPGPAAQQELATAATQPAPAASGGLPVSPEQAMNVRALLEGALAAGQPAAQLAAEITANVGPQMAMVLAQSVTPEAVTASLQAMPDGAASPLLRRDGQKFLRELHQAMRGGAA